MQGEELKALRKQTGLTQIEMAKVLDLSPTWVGQMERGETKIERRTELAARFILFAKLLDGYETGRIKSVDEDERGQLTLDTSEESIARLRAKLDDLLQTQK